MNKLFVFHNGYSRAGIRFNEEPPIMSYLSVNMFEEMVNQYKLDGNQIFYVDKEEKLELDLELSR
jgi:hypothetical protein